MAARRGISQGLLVTPVIIGLGLDATVTPLNAMLDVAAWLRWVYYGGLVLIGFVLFRRARVERDHEHRRSASLKELKTVFKAEEQGLWERSDAAPPGGPLSVESGAKVGGLTREEAKSTSKQRLTSRRFTGCAFRRATTFTEPWVPPGRHRGWTPCLTRSGASSAVVMISLGADINDARQPFSSAPRETH